MLAQSPSLLRLWYRRPAKKWTEALPLGNGRLGAMVFGRVDTEILQLNEDTLWSGEPQDLNDYGAFTALPEARSLINQGKLKEAEKLVAEKMIGQFQQSYLTLGSLKICNQNSGKITKYERELDLETAIAHTKYQQGIQNVH
jgi:alpha-L-fucosidase 2